MTGVCGQGSWASKGAPRGAQEKPKGSPGEPMGVSWGAHGGPEGAFGAPWGPMGDSWAPGHGDPMRCFTQKGWSGQGARGDTAGFLNLKTAQCVSKAKKSVEADGADAKGDASSGQTVKAVRRASKKSALKRVTNSNVKAVRRAFEKSAPKRVTNSVSPKVSKAM